MSSPAKKYIPSSFGTLLYDGLNRCLSFLVEEYICGKLIFFNSPAIKKKQRLKCIFFFSSWADPSA